MRILMISLLFLCCIACNKKNHKEIPVNNHEEDSVLLKEIVMKDSLNIIDSIIIDDQIEGIKSLKSEKLIELKDDLSELQNLIITKKFYKEEDQFVLDFKYPLLNENLDPDYRSFNDFIKHEYIDIKGAEAQILEDKELYCDTLRTNNYREKRKVDFKVYQTKEHLLSVLFYKENYYSGAMNSTYLFDCMNFDLENYQFLNYDDFFVENSEEELFTIINQIILDGIETGEIYFDCWELSLGDFNEYKNNFVVDEHYFEFFFDDCVICPVYTGTFSVEIPIDTIIPLLKLNKSKSNI